VFIQIYIELPLTGTVWRLCLQQLAVTKYDTIQVLTGVVLSSYMWRLLISFS